MNKTRTLIVSVLLALLGSLVFVVPSQAQDTFAAKRTQVTKGPWKRFAYIPPRTCPNGDSGKRVQVVYMRAYNQPSRLNEVRTQIRQGASDANTWVTEASLRNGGVRRDIAYQRNADCSVTVREVVIGENDWTDRKIKETDPNWANHTYVIYDDLSDYYCGLASPAEPGEPGYAWIAAGCWNGETVVHEFMHTIGAVDPKAPNSTGNGMHCKEGEDVMCYEDNSAPYKPFTYPCAVKVLDCNLNDYFNANPLYHSWLSLNPHANTALSKFLLRNGKPQNYYPLTSR